MTWPGLVCGIRCAGNKADRREPSRSSVCRRQGRIRGNRCRLVDIGFSGNVPDLPAGRQRPFPWDGSLRSALFPRKGSLASSLKHLYRIDRCAAAPNGPSHRPNVLSVSGFTVSAIASCSTCSASISTSQQVRSKYFSQGVGNHNWFIFASSSAQPSMALRLVPANPAYCVDTCPDLLGLRAGLDLRPRTRRRTTADSHLGRTHPAARYMRQPLRVSRRWATE